MYLAIYGILPHPKFHTCSRITPNWVQASNPHFVSHLYEKKPAMICTWNSATKMLLDVLVALCTLLDDKLPQSWIFLVPANTLWMTGIPWHHYLWFLYIIPGFCFSISIRQNLARVWKLGPFIAIMRLWIVLYVISSWCYAFALAEIMVMV